MQELRERVAVAEARKFDPRESLPRGIGEDFWREPVGQISGASYMMASAPAGGQTYTAAQLGTTT